MCVIFETRGRRAGSKWRLIEVSTLAGDAGRDADALVILIGEWKWILKCGICFEWRELDRFG